MDNAVALVQTYLRVNGYLTVSEYPVIEALPSGGYQASTDLDILAFRFQHAPPADGGPVPDPALRLVADSGDMLIGEVKEGRAVLNRAATNPQVLAAALVRFGCCPPESVQQLVDGLIRTGKSTTPAGHRVRLVAFGSLPPEHAPRSHEVMLLGDILDFLHHYMRQNWSRIQASESKDPGLSFLMTLEKAHRGGRGASRAAVQPTDARL